MANLRLLRRPTIIPVGNQSKFQFLKLQLTITNSSIYEMCLTQVVFPNGAYMYSICMHTCKYQVHFIIGGGSKQKSTLCTLAKWLKIVDHPLKNMMDNAPGLL